MPLHWSRESYRESLPAFRRLRIGAQGSLPAPTKLPLSGALETDLGPATDLRLNERLADFERRLRVPFGPIKDQGASRGDLQKSPPNLCQKAPVSKYSNPPTI